MLASLHRVESRLRVCGIMAATLEGGLNETPLTAATPPRNIANRVRASATARRAGQNADLEIAAGAIPSVCANRWASCKA